MLSAFLPLCNNVFGIDKEAEMRCLKFMSDQDYNSALPCFNQLISMESNNANLYGLRAGVYSGLGETQKAIDDINVVINIDTSNAMAYATRGSLNIILGKNDAGLKDISYAITELDKMDGNDILASSLYQQRASVYDKIGNYEKAASDFISSSKILKRVDDQYQVKEMIMSNNENICMIYLKSKQYDKSIPYCKTSATGNNAIDLKNNLASAYIENGRHQDAIDVINSIAKIDMNIVSYLNLAVAQKNLYKLKKDAKYNEEYEKNMKIAEEKAKTTEQRDMVMNVLRRVS
jgi:tetratricopeptide (TPR) repeat protein